MPAPCSRSARVCLNAREAFVLSAENQSLCWATCAMPWHPSLTSSPGISSCPPVVLPSVRRPFFGVSTASLRRAAAMRLAPPLSSFQRPQRRSPVSRLVSVAAHRADPGVRVVWSPSASRRPLDPPTRPALRSVPLTPSGSRPHAIACSRSLWLHGWSLPSRRWFEPAASPHCCVAWGPSRDLRVFLRW
jgi:hypothetical protein